MNNDELDLFARLSMHEFLLEIAYANALSPMPEPDRQKVIDQILSKIRFSTWTRESENSDAAMAMQQSMIRIGEQFFAKVTKRL